VGAVIAIAAVAGFFVWYFAIRDTDNNENNAPINVGRASKSNSIRPVAATPDDISSLAMKDKQPIYWAEDQAGTSDLELTKTADGNVYVRYLTDDAQVGTPKPAYLTVGTYPFGNSVNAIDAIAKRPGAHTYHVANDGIAVQNSNSPTSVYLAYPDEKRYEIEVYDPDPAKALDLVKSGDIQPVP
jgi:hypothetical protein